MSLSRINVLKYFLLFALSGILIYLVLNKSIEKLITKLRCEILFKLDDSNKNTLEEFQLRICVLRIILLQL